MWDSIFIATAYPSPISTTPAFSAPGATSSRSECRGSVLSSRLVCLYPQCSLHIAPNSPSSKFPGSLPSRSTMASYSGSESAISSSISLGTGMNQV